MKSPQSPRKPGRSRPESRTNGEDTIALIPPLEIKGIEPTPKDIMLFIHDGVPILRTPEHEGGVVPEDFLIMLGVATVFLDPGFRAKMHEIVNEAHGHGMLDGIINDGRGN